MVKFPCSLFRPRCPGEPARPKCGAEAAREEGRLAPAVLREHYAHVASKPFYPEIEQFMSSRPVIIMALQGDNIVQQVRDLLGPTDSRKAAKGTIRGDFGVDVMVNVCHASDSLETAAAELKRFFQPGELF